MMSAGPNVTDLVYGFRLHEKFCAFVEWAFGPGGIASLRAIVVGDFSISICRNEDGTFTLLDEIYGRRDQALDDYRDFLASC